MRWGSSTASRVDAKLSKPNAPSKPLSTDPTYFDIELPAGGSFEHTLPAGHTAFVYVYEGAIAIGDGNAARTVPLQAAGVLSPGDRVILEAGAQGARLILLAGRPLREPIVQYGPFVMNTREEIEQAIQDYQRGELVQAA